MLYEQFRKESVFLPSVEAQNTLCLHFTMALLPAQLPGPLAALCLLAQTDNLVSSQQLPLIGNIEPIVLVVQTVQSGHAQRLLLVVVVDEPHLMLSE